MNLPTMHFKWVMRPMVKWFGKRRFTTEKVVGSTFKTETNSIHFEKRGRLNFIWIM